MSSDISLFVTNDSVIVLKTSSTFPTTSINNSAIKNLTRSLCIERIKLKVIYLAPAEATYYGLFFDRQRAIENTANTKGYECYLMDTRRSSIVCTHNIEFLEMGISKNFLPSLKISLFLVLQYFIILTILKILIICSIVSLIVLHISSIMVDLLSVGGTHKAKLMISQIEI